MSSSVQRFTDAQRHVIDTWGQGVAVLAGAGSGKTTTIVEKCRVLIERNPQARFAAVSFTEKSARDIEKKLAQAGVLETAAGLQSVGTIHGFCGNLIREFEQEAGLEGGEKVLSDIESTLLWESAVRELWSDGLPTEVRGALECLWGRESRRDLEKLLARVREVEGFGALRLWEQLNRGEEDAVALKHCAEFVLSRYEKIKSRQGVLDFTDLEKRALRCLESSTVQRSLADRFDLVLGDEFQDTNPIQAEIMSRIIRADRSNVVVVGDPKQSIYRFRDADVSLFQKFCASLPVQVELVTNFRSEPAVLSWINEACAPAFAQSQMEYHALKPGRSSTLGEDETVGVRKLLVDVEPEIAAAQVADFLRARAKSENVGLSEYVLLLRSVRGGQGARFLQGLARAQLPVLLLSGGDFWGDPRVAELIAVLEWYWGDGSTQSAVTVLRAPWVAFPDSLIDQVLASRQVPALGYWQTFAAMPEFQATPLPALALLRKEKGLGVRPGEVLETLLNHRSLEAELAEEMRGVALGLWHRIEDWSETGLSFGEILEQLRRARDEGRREKELPPPEDSAGSVRVMTVHSSKGLEFPRVILVELGKKKSAAKAPLFFWDRQAGAFLGRKLPDGKRLGEDDPEEKLWRQREAVLEGAESRRVFYVALTRAEKEILLVCPDIEEGKKREIWREWVDAAPAPVLRLDPISVPLMQTPASRIPHSRVATVHSPRWRRSRHSVTEWNWLARCDRAYVAKIRGLGVLESEEWGESAARSAMNEKRRDEHGVSGQSEDLGTQVHRALEDLHAADLSEALRVFAAIEERWGSARFRAAPLLAWWESDQERLRAEGSQVLNEFAFDLTIGNSQEILVGAMDRVERCGEKLRVLDYKVVGKSKSLDDWAQLYGTQMRLYSAALRQLSGAQEVETVLLAISPEDVNEIRLPIPTDENAGAILEHFAQRAERWVRSTVDLQAAPARPSAACRFCPALQQCSEGRALSL